MTLLHRHPERTSQQDRWQYIQWFYYQRSWTITLPFIYLPLKICKKNTTRKRSITLDLEYQNTASLVELPIEARKKIQKSIQMKDICCFIFISILSGNMYHSISGVAFFNYWCLLWLSPITCYFIFIIC